MRRSAATGWWLWPLLLCWGLSGCQASDYWHLARGHLALMSARVPLAQGLEDRTRPAAEREALGWVQALRRFAAEQMDVPVGDAYSLYVPLDRPWVVWNLFVAPEFSLQPQAWCAPVAGCVSYRGFFDRERAQRQARRWEERGFHTYQGGVSAYSTLGWFADPVTTPMLRGGRAAVAELLLHELTHRRLYLPGDTRFNESLATAVGREGARRWLAREGDLAGLAMLAEQERAARWVLAAVADTRWQLERLYARSDLDDGARRRQAQALREALRQHWRQQVAGQGADSALARWQGWFAGPLNNAQLATLMDYHDWVPAFDRLLLSCGGHWDCFWQQVQALAALPAAARHAQLQQWTHS